MPKRLYLDPEDAREIAKAIYDRLQADDIQGVSGAQTIEAITRLIGKPMYLGDNSSTYVKEPLSQQDIAAQLGLPANPPPGYSTRKGDPNPVMESLTADEAVGRIEAARQELVERSEAAEEEFRRLVRERSAALTDGERLVIGRQLVRAISDHNQLMEEYLRNTGQL